MKVETCGSGVFATKKERNFKEQWLGFRNGGPQLLNECRGNTGDGAQVTNSLIKLRHRHTMSVSEIRCRFRL